MSALTPDQGYFTFTAEYANGVTVQVQAPTDTNLSDLADTLETFLIAVGYDPHKVREMLK